MEEEEANDNFKTESLLKTESEIYSDWNPLLEESQSFLNTISYDDGDPVSTISGNRGLKVSDIPCKLFKHDSPNATCGRLKCRFLHDRKVALGLITSKCVHI